MRLAITEKQLMKCEVSHSYGYNDDGDDRCKEGKTSFQKNVSVDLETFTHVNRQTDRQTYTDRQTETDGQTYTMMSL